VLVVYVRFCRFFNDSNSVAAMRVSNPDCSSVANRAQHVRPCSHDTPHHAIGYAMHSSRSHDAVIRVYDAGFVTSRVLNRNVKVAILSVPSSDVKVVPGKSKVKKLFGGTKKSP